MKIPKFLRRKKQLPECTGSLQVRLIGDEDTMHGELGISEERANEIMDLVTAQIRKHHGKSVVHAAVELSAEAKHPNELWLMCAYATHKCMPFPSPFTSFFSR